MAFADGAEAPAENQLEAFLTMATDHGNETTGRGGRAPRTKSVKGHDKSAGATPYARPTTSAARASDGGGGGRRESGVFGKINSIASYVLGSWFTGAAGGSGAEEKPDDEAAGAKHEASAGVGAGDGGVQEKSSRADEIHQLVAAINKREERGEPLTPSELDTLNSLRLKGEGTGPGAANENGIVASPAQASPTFGSPRLDVPAASPRVQDKGNTRLGGAAQTDSAEGMQSPFTAVRSILRQPLNISKDLDLGHVPSPLATDGLKRRISFDAAGIVPRSTFGRPRAFNTPVGKQPSSSFAIDRRVTGAPIGQSGGDRAHLAEGQESLLRRYPQSTVQARRPAMQWDTPSRSMSGARYGMKRQRDAFGLDSVGGMGPSRRRPRVSFDSAIRGTAIYGTPARATHESGAGTASALRLTGSDENGRGDRLPSSAVAMKILDTLDNLETGVKKRGEVSSAKKKLLESPFASRAADPHLTTPMSTLGDKFGAPHSGKKAAFAPLLRNVLSESKRTQLKLTGAAEDDGKGGSAADPDAAKMPPPPVPKDVLESKVGEKKLSASFQPNLATPKETSKAAHRVTFGAGASEAPKGDSGRGKENMGSTLATDSENNVSGSSTKIVANAVVDGNQSIPFSFSDPGGQEAAAITKIKAISGTTPPTSPPPKFSFRVPSFEIGTEPAPVAEAEPTLSVKGSPASQTATLTSNAAEKETAEPSGAGLSKPTSYKDTTKRSLAASPSSVGGTFTGLKEKKADDDTRSKPLLGSSVAVPQKADTGPLAVKVDGEERVDGGPGPLASPSPSFAAFGAGTAQPTAFGAFGETPKSNTAQKDQHDIFGSQNKSIFDTTPAVAGAASGFSFGDAAKPLKAGDENAKKEDNEKAAGGTAGFAFGSVSKPADALPGANQPGFGSTPSQGAFGGIAAANPPGDFGLSKGVADGGETNVNDDPAKRSRTPAFGASEPIAEAAKDPPQLAAAVVGGIPEKGPSVFGGPAKADTDVPVPSTGAFVFGGSKPDQPKTADEAAKAADVAAAKPAFNFGSSAGTTGSTSFTFGSKDKSVAEEKGAAKPFTFGRAPTAAAATVTAFGGVSEPDSTPTPPAPAFGQANSSAPAFTFGVAASAGDGAPVQNPGFSPLGSTQPANQTPAFGGGVAGAQPPAPAPTTNVFGQASTTSFQFGTPAAAPADGGSFTFGSQAPSQKPSLASPTPAFGGGGGIFGGGSASTPPPQQASGVFGMGQPQQAPAFGQPQQPAPMAFGQPAAAPAPAFGMAPGGGSTFGASPATSAPGGMTLGASGADGQPKRRIVRAKRTGKK